MIKIKEIKIICRQCNKIFYRKPYLKRVFCSHHCQVISRFYKGHPSYVDNKGINSYAWKGQNVGYVGLHQWVRRELGKPSKCDFCGISKNQIYDWANKSGKYLRNLDDWFRLCRKCHTRYDKDMGLRGRSLNDYLE